MSSVSEGILYILVFGLGSIIGMLLAGAVISVPVVASAKRFSLRKTVSLAGLLSVALGLLIVWESGSFLIR